MIRWKEFSDRITVTWEDIPQYSKSNTYTFQVELYFDGKIRISWLEIETDNCIVGLSRGLGVPSNFEDQEIDFSELSSSPSSPTPGDVPGVPTGRRNRKK
jgi:hypothetical protein